MNLTLELKPEVELLLEERARVEGCDVQTYATKLLEKELNRERTFDEILAPFRESVEKSGMSDEELEALFTKARREASRERRARQQG